MWAICIPKILAAAGNDAPLVDRVIAAARSIIGKREINGNAGFTDPAFQKRMQEVGWKKGEAWCAYTGEEIWKEAFTKDHALYNDIDKLFSASAIKTYENFSKSDKFKTGDEPKPGALVIWRHGSSWQGHLGVVTDVLYGDQFKSVEGNSNTGGSREGIEVVEKLRQLHQPHSLKGLNIEGFVYLPE
jgi:hypothetical protein